MHGETLTAASLSLEDWQQYLRLMEILSESELEINIESSGLDLPPISSKVKLEIPKPQEPWISYLAEIARRGEALLKFAGAKGKGTTLEELNEAADMVNTAYARLFEPNTAPTKTFHTTGHELSEMPLSDVEFLYADCVVFAGVALAYACRVTMRPEPAGTGLIWRQVAAKPEKLLVIDKTVEAFKNFVSDAREQTGLQNMMIRDMNSDGGGTPDAPGDN